MIYTAPGQAGALVSFKSRYDNFIGGDWVAPRAGRYFENISPVDGRVFCEVARSDAADIELALDAAHKAFASWSKTSVTERSNLLLRIADRIEQNIEVLAVAETWENGKAVRETLAADLPWWWITSATSPAASAPRRAPPPSWTRTPSATTSRSPSGWSARSSRGTSPADGRLEAGPGTGGRLLQRAQARRADPGHHHADDGSHQGHPAPGVVQRGQRLRRRGGPGARHQQPDPEAGVYRIHRGGRPYPALRRRQADPLHRGARWQVPNIYFADVMQHESSYIDKAVEGMLMTFFNQGGVYLPLPRPGAGQHL